jgi:hypothetical protein
MSGAHIKPSRGGGDVSLTTLMMSILFLHVIVCAMSIRLFTLEKNEALSPGLCYLRKDLGASNLTLR